MPARKTKRTTRKVKSDVESWSMEQPAPVMEMSMPKEKSLADKLLPLVLIVMVFSVVSQIVMWNKISGLTAGAPGAKYKTFEDAMKDLAKKAKVKDVNKAMKCMTSGEKAAAVAADQTEGTGLGVNGTPAFFINGRLIPGALPFDEFKKIIDQELGVTAMDATVDRKTVTIGDAPTQGDPNAPVKIVEYSDFQCPFCERAYPTVQQILKDYAGKVMIAYKQFPLSIHPRAEKTAELAVCARDQGKFWEMHNQLFEKQGDWANL